MELKEKHHRLLRREQHIENENKQALIQAETVSMMTKYQLVFVKIENIFSKIANNQTTRERLELQDSFYQIKRCSIYKSVHVNYKTHMIYLKMRSRYTNAMVNAYKRKLTRQLGLALNRWKAQTQVPKVQAEVEKQS